jgi:hypothetical protein
MTIWVATGRARAKMTLPLDSLTRSVIVGLRNFQSISHRSKVMTCLIFRFLMMNAHWKFWGKNITHEKLFSFMRPHGIMCDLGGSLDSEVMLHYYITKLAAVYFHHLRRLYVSSAGALAKMSLFFWLLPSSLLRLDYCNPVFAGLPQCSISSLRHIQNAAARIVFSVRRRDSLTPALNTTSLPFWPAPYSVQTVHHHVPRSNWLMTEIRL